DPPAPARLSGGAGPRRPRALPASRARGGGPSRRAWEVTPDQGVPHPAFDPPPPRVQPAPALMPRPAPALALLPLALLLSGCKPAAAKKHAGTPEDPFVIGMSQCNRGEPWRVQMDEDVKQAAAKHPNVKVIFKDAQNESLTQRAQVEELLAQGI